MRDDEFQKAMETWSDAELEAAPDLSPTPEMRRLVQAKQARRRAFPLSSPWATGAALPRCLRANPPARLVVADWAEAPSPSHDSMRVRACAINRGYCLVGAGGASR